uniref:Putative secreted protein n=1 Tax=Anopheles darlingi TaxID=43151 RepID=A0A2M4DGD1_ANODA
MQPSPRGLLLLLPLLIPGFERIYQNPFHSARRTSYALAFADDLSIVACHIRSSIVPSFVQAKTVGNDHMIPRQEGGFCI